MTIYSMYFKIVNWWIHGVFFVVTNRLLLLWWVRAKISRAEPLRGRSTTMWTARFAIFWPPSPWVDSFHTLSLDKNRHFLTPFPSPSSCPRTQVCRIDVHVYFPAFVLVFALHTLLILRKKSPLHGLIWVCTCMFF